MYMGLALCALILVPAAVHSYYTRRLVVPTYIMYVYCTMAQDRQGNNILTAQYIIIKDNY